MLSPFPIKCPLKAFQYKILNSILYTNKKLLQIRYCEHDGCTFCDKESETSHHPFFLLPLLEYLLETSRKLLFHNDKPSYGSQPSRYHYRYYNIVMPFTKLFDTNRKNTYLRLQKDACASEYSKFQTKSENLFSNRKKHCLNK